MIELRPSGRNFTGRPTSYEDEMDVTMKRSYKNIDAVRITEFNFRVSKLNAGSKTMKSGKEKDGDGAE